MASEVAVRTVSPVASSASLCRDLVPVSHHWPRQHIGGNLALEPLPIRRIPQKLAILDDHLAAQDGHHRIALTRKPFPDAVVGVSVQVRQGDRLSQMWIDEH